MEQPFPSLDRRYTVAEYFRIEATADQKFEYREGELLAMAGGMESHSRITANVIRSLGNRIDASPCRVYDSNFRVRAKRSARYVYPDAFVISRPREFDPDDAEHATALDPKLIVGVLSKSTRLSDRGETFAYYRSY
jgi:Uma2 family endonuclease